MHQVKEYNLLFIIKLLLCAAVGLHETCAQCQPFLTTAATGSKGQPSSINVAWAMGCEPTSDDDALFWQKWMSGSWINVFKCTSSNLNGFPIDTTGDYNLIERSSGSFDANGHQLTIDISQPCDSGTWRVQVEKGEEVFISSNNRTLSINETTQSFDVLIISPERSEWLAGRNLQFTCTVDIVRPKAITSWTFNGSTSPGEDMSLEKECGGDVWTVNNIVSRSFNTLGNVDVRCVLDQDGHIIESNSTSVNISAPPKLEERISLVPINPLANKRFTLSCTASGSDVVITWTKDTLILDKETEYFEKPVLSYADRENLDYGQSQVKISILTSKPIYQATADGIREQSGLFKCEAKVLSEAVADEITILLGYHPIPEGDTVNITKAKADEEVEFICAVISNPQAKFTWEYQGHMLVETTSKLNRIADKKTGGLYTCSAANIIGHTSLYFYLEIDNSCKSIRVGEVVGIVLGVLIAVTLPVIIGIVFYRKRSMADTANKAITYPHNLVFESDYENQENHPASSTTNTTTTEGNANTPTNYEELSRVALYNNGHINVYDAIHVNREVQ